jgi:hypothetical protein
MIKQTLYFLLIITGLSVLGGNVGAQLIADKTVINSSTGSATVSVSFPAQIKGDLYLATILDNQFLFFTANGAATTKATPFQANHTFNQTIKVLTIASSGIPAGTYPLYQVVTLAGKEPWESTNWIGELSQLDFSINLPVSTKSGEDLYHSLTCSDGGCHTANPKKNINKILNGKSLAAIRLSIKKNPITMGRFNGVSDEDLQAIADYLQMF